MTKNALCSMLGHKWELCRPVVGPRRWQCKRCHEIDIEVERKDSDDAEFERQYLLEWGRKLLNDDMG